MIDNICSGFCREQFEELFHYHGSDLGAVYQKEQTQFRVWAPTASQVDLLIYSAGQGGESAVYPMQLGAQGTWVITLRGDLHGIYYNYQVNIGGKVHEVVDPYAKATGVNGERGMVIDFRRTDPVGWDQLKKPRYVNFVDAIIYELHIRDLSTHEQSGILHKGKFLGLTEQGTTGPRGVKTGLDHLRELGITHVHLLPCFDFATIDESRLDLPAFNWGYDPQNFSVPEGSYATNPFDGQVRIVEFKQMVKALNEAGIRVVMDVVYNHTFLSEDSNLNKLVPGYYYRKWDNGEFSNGSGCGNELASERFMVRKLIVDSVVHWAKEYKIDGFRFDLMGLHDLETMKQIRRALDAVDPDILIYGEGWTGGPSPLPDSQKALKGSISLLPGIAAFNDDFRDGVKGNVFNSSAPGFVTGAKGMEETVKFGLAGAVQHPQVHNQQVIYAHQAWAAEPGQCVNYVEAHDNLTLWDKILYTLPFASEEERIQIQKMAIALVLTAQGIPFLQAGMDFLRTKNGDHNSYRSPDWVNQLDWPRKAKYIDVFKSVRGLIHLRREHPAFRMVCAQQIRKNLQFLSMPQEGMVGFHLRNGANGDSWRDIVVLVNARQDAQIVELPGNNWYVVADGQRAGVDKLWSVEGHEVNIPGRTVLILADQASLE